MRLTLRTLLAYLDDVLEPAEAQDLGGRIQESEFATNLVHRIREAMRREKLGAPRLQGKAAGLDPNTVAEYLDNTLSGERVVDFEKHCLESEVHLAETACCHQVLALVLGEPAMVDPDARRRIYGLLEQYDARLKSGATPSAASAALGGSSLSPNSLSPNSLSPSSLSAGSLPAGSLPADSLAGNPNGVAIDDFPRASFPSQSHVPSSFAPPTALRKRAEVPDYLRPEALGLSAWWKLAAAALVAVLLVCAVTMATAPLWNRDGGTPRHGSGDGATASINPATTEEPLHQPDHAQGKTGEAKTNEGRVVEGAKTEANPIEGAKTEPAKTEGAKTEPPKTAEAKKSSAVIELPKGNDPPAVGPKAKPMVETEPPPKVSPKVDAPKAVPMGDGANVARLTLTERKSVLFKLDGRSGRWSRLTVPASLSAGEVFLCPPACRNTLMVRGDLQVQTVGDTRLELQASPAGTPPGIHLHYGRLMLMTAGDGRTSVPLQAGDHVGKIIFTKPGAALALEARLVRTPGSDPEKTRSRTVVDLFAMGTGSIVWDEGNGQPITVDAPGRRTIGLAEGESQPEGAAVWANPEQLSITEQLGFNVLESKLQNQAADNLNESLLEWIVVQQREVQSLAYRWLVSIDQFDDAVRALGQSKNRESYFWPKIIEHVRLAVARDAQTAAKVRQSLEKIRGEKAPGLYRMLWGYSEQDVVKGDEAKRLVGYLEHEDLDYRVLASWNLGDITGNGVGFYRPDGPADLQQQFVREWKKKLEMGKIAPGKKKQ